MEKRDIEREERMFQMMERIAMSLEKVVEGQMAVIEASKELVDRRAGVGSRRAILEDRRSQSAIDRRAAEGLPALPLQSNGNGNNEALEDQTTTSNGAFEHPSVLTATQVARMLNTSKGTVYLWVNQNKIPFIKIGGSIRFPEDEIHRWISNGTVLEKPSSSARRIQRRTSESTNPA
ncbi:MAG: excisionase family DNA binding protein [Candidatus Omnitrophota bacterium]|jgi:excisionase family DNA binding protein